MFGFLGILCIGNVTFKHIKRKVKVLFIEDSDRFGTRIISYLLTYTRR